MTDLVARLRRTKPGYVGTLNAEGIATYALSEQEVLNNPDGPEAADCIETLEAEKANLQSNVAELCDAIRKMRDHPMCPVEVGVIGDAVLAKIRNHARAVLEASHHVELVGALWSAKRLIENINEFGVVTDVEFVDEADSRIGSALALIDHA